MSMQVKKASSLITGFAKKLKAAGLAINGVALSGNNATKAGSTFTALPPSLLAAGDEAYLRIDWKSDPSVADLKKVQTVLNGLNLVKLLGKRTNLTGAEVLSQLTAMTAPKQQDMLLKLSARLLRVYPDLADDLSVALDRPTPS